MSNNQTIVVAGVELHFSAEEEFHLEQETEFHFLLDFYGNREILVNSEIEFTGHADDEDFEQTTELTIKEKSFSTHRDRLFKGDFIHIVVDDYGSDTVIELVRNNKVEQDFDYDLTEEELATLKTEKGRKRKMINSRPYMDLLDEKMEADERVDPRILETGNYPEE
jgi:hypothetical protein